MNDFFKELDKIQKRKISPVYFLHGNDIFMKHELSRVLFQTDNKAEKKVFYGNQGSDEDVAFLDNLVSFGLFSTKKIIVYYDIEKFTTKYRDKVLRYIKNPDTNIILVLIAEKATIKFVKEISTNAKIIKVWTPFPNQYVDFVHEQINRMGIEISGEAVNLLTSITNDSLHHTFAEFEKVLINSGSNHKITSDAVKKVVGGEKKYDMWDFIEAIGNKNFYRSIDICNGLSQMGIKTPFFIISLYSFFNDMYVCFSEDVNKLFSYNWKKKQQISSTIGNYRSADFSKIFHVLNETDLKGKSTGLSTEELIVPLIYEILNA